MMFLRVLSILTLAAGASLALAQTTPKPKDAPDSERAKLIQEFRKDGKKQISASVIDRAIADEIAERFGGDRQKFLAHLRAQGKTLRDYRREVEEDIIYSYMRNQQRRENSAHAPPEKK